MYSIEVTSNIFDIIVFIDRDVKVSDRYNSN